MAEGKNLFPEAENDKYDISNVLNVLNDDAYMRKMNLQPAVNNEDASDIDINVEEGAPFKEGIDLDAPIGDYMELNEETPLEEEIPEQENVEDDNLEEEIPDEINETLLDDAEDLQDIEQGMMELEAPQGVRSPVITKQVKKARDKFTDDLRMLDNESAIQRLKKIDEEKAAEEAEKREEIATAQEHTHEAVVKTVKETVEEQPDEAEDDVLTFKEMITSSARRIKKPRFSKKAEKLDAKKTEEASEEDELGPVDAIQTLKDQKKDMRIMDEGILTESKTGPQDALSKENDLAEEQEKTATTQEKRSEKTADAEKPESKHSVYDDLMELQKYLEEASSPMLHKTEVLVPREKTLRLIRSLTALGEVDPSYIDGVAEDRLIDHIVSEHSGTEYEPLKRAHQRAQAIIQGATKQADIIIGDAKTLSTQLLAQTETEIKEKYDVADEEIAVRMNTTKEESSKKLNEARSELTMSRQHSVEILNKYLEKAENDYQGYWERAENTMLASLEQSEYFLSKAQHIYEKELAVIRQDKEELDEILEHLKRYKKF